VSGRLLPFGLGFLFAVGLVTAGMTDPAKVVAFLDVFGRWDPSLAFVMIGAIGVYAVVWRRVAGWPHPLRAERFSNPIPTRIDGRLVAGAAVFGIGWGMSGFCPGPALVSLGAGASSALWFVPAMVAGMMVHDRLVRSREVRATTATEATAPTLVGDG
jgi:uncharacterized membrane protein YedE/YeeE